MRTARGSMAKANRRDDKGHPSRIPNSATFGFWSSYGGMDKHPLYCPSGTSQLIPICRMVFQYIEMYWKTKVAEFGINRDIQPYQKL